MALPLLLTPLPLNPASTNPLYSPSFHVHANHTQLSTQYMIVNKHSHLVSPLTLVQPLPHTSNPCMFCLYISYAVLNLELSNVFRFWTWLHCYFFSLCALSSFYIAMTLFKLVVNIVSIWLYNIVSKGLPAAKPQIRSYTIRRIGFSCCAQSFPYSHFKIPKFWWWVWTAEWSPPCCYWKCLALHVCSKLLNSSYEFLL